VVVLLLLLLVVVVVAVVAVLTIAAIIITFIVIIAIVVIRSLSGVIFFAVCLLSKYESAPSVQTCIRSSDKVLRYCLYCNGKTKNDWEFEPMVRAQLRPKTAPPGEVLFTVGGPSLDG
jgi:hypothetical protein